MSGDILSQDEIDALLTAVADGTSSLDEPAAKFAPTPLAPLEPDPNQMTEQYLPSDSSSDISWLFEDDDDLENTDDKRLNLYDFARPQRISKDHMRTIEGLHDSYARQFSTMLTNYLRTFVDINVVSVDQLSYHEVINSYATTSCLHLFRMEPIEITAIFEMNPALAFFIIDQLFGGQGKSSEQIRGLTSIEQNVIRNIVSRGLDELADTWQHLGDFSPKITSYETNPLFVQIAPLSETFVLITFEMSINKASGLMSIAFPYKIIEMLLSYMTSESWITTQVQTTAETRKIMEEEIQDLMVPLSVLIGQTKLTVRDLLQLEKDDIICLDKHKDEDLIIQIGGKSKMGGKSGIVGRKKAVKITKIIEEEVPGADSKYDNNDDHDEIYEQGA